MALNKAVSFAANETRNTIRVEIKSTVDISGISESIDVALTNVSTGTLASDCVATGTIKDLSQSIWAIKSNGDSSQNSEYLSYTVYRNGDTTKAASIKVATSGGSASTTTDYDIVDSTLYFAADEIAKTVLVKLNNDIDLEKDETVILSITAPTEGILGTVSASGTIYENDQSIWRVGTIANRGNAVNHVSEGSDYVAFYVKRTGNITEAATIKINTAGGTATAGKDYVAIDQNITFAAGESKKTILVKVLTDNELENTESIVLAINNVSDGTIEKSVATSYIYDSSQSIWRVDAITDEAFNRNIYKKGAISYVNGYEEPSVDEGAGYITYVVTRKGDTSKEEIITVATIGGTARSGVDYEMLSPTQITFAAGETKKSLLVKVYDDTSKEENNSVNLYIMNPTGGVIENASASVVINDNDQSVWSVDTASITDAYRYPQSHTASYGDEGQGYITYTVSRTGDISQAATIKVSTMSGLATAGVDYEAINEYLTFNAGESLKTVLVKVYDDTVLESLESVTLVISDANKGIINTSSATSYIYDNEQSIWSVNVAQDWIAHDNDEGSGYITYVVTRNGNTESAADINIKTVDGTALSGTDYTAINETLHFNAGETTKTVLVKVSDDCNFTGDKSLYLNIFGQSSGVISNTEAIGRIVDNDYATNSTTKTITEIEGMNNYLYDSNTANWTVYYNP